MKENRSCKAKVCVAALGAAFAASPLAAAEVAHRWSFNGGRVHMGYGACSHGTGYVDLGTNMLDTTAAIF